MPSASRHDPSQAAHRPESDWAELDRRAWQAICQWPQHARAPVRCRGLDYAHLTRWFLWDKVGRAMRRFADPEGFAGEAAELGWGPEQAAPASVDALRLPELAFARRLRRTVGRVRHTLARPLASGGVSLHFRDSGLPRVLVPVPTPRTGRTAERLADEGAVQVLVPEAMPHKVAGAVAFPYPPVRRQPDWAFMSRLYRGIIEGLAAQDVPLSSGDAATLYDQLVQQARQMVQAEAVLEQVRPDALLVHADNHPTCQYYVLLGRKLGIPSVMLQHGLDCEWNYLDEAYASAVATWGEARAERYRRYSQRQPEEIAVLGNPEYDDLRPPGALDASGDFWLWIGRPHAAAKCYAPSRSPLEGVRILHALLAACAKKPGQRLVIKPHPYDAVERYREMIAAWGLADRVTLSDERPLDLFARASVVASEDSTAALEAMFFGKPLVHVHFAPSPPTLPLVDYGAALAGFHPEEVAESLEHAGRLSYAAAAEMLAGQRRFLQDYAGPCDGRAAERVAAFVLRKAKTR